VDDAGTVFGQWWAGAYAFRNAVVHQGAEIPLVEAELSFNQVSAIAVAIATGLRARPATADLGDMLTWGHRL
jgi:hypothetical protein